MFSCCRCAVTCPGSRSCGRGGLDETQTVITDGSSTFLPTRPESYRAVGIPCSSASPYIMAVVPGALGLVVWQCFRSSPADALAGDMPGSRSCGRGGLDETQTVVGALEKWTVDVEVFRSSYKEHYVFHSLSFLIPLN
ncbi:unnamed protein product [Gadus morhua 'NCC']